MPERTRARGGLVVVAGLACAASLVIVAGTLVRAQSSTNQAAPAAAAPPKDTLGRDTPRGTVLGFMNAGRDGRTEITPLYLNTGLRDRAAVDLAHKLYVVLDRRLPARLTELSDRPEGSLSNPLQPNRDSIGHITTVNGPLEIVVERVNRGTLGPVWLFAGETLDAVPDVYGELDRLSIDAWLPTFLTQRRIGNIRLLAWISLFVLVPLLYRLAGVIGQFVVVPLLVRWRRRRGAKVERVEQLPPGFVRLLILAILIRWMIIAIELPLLERQFWSAIAALLLVAAVTWALLVANGGIARRLAQRFRASSHSEMTAMLGLLRRLGDLIVLTVASLATLNYFGINPTAALAGLGIGGIAVALAAQKTLENVIGGLSIIFDDAVRVGDSVKLGDVVGSVDSIGLRSTRIRTIERTILSVPNGQIANANIETLSVRDKFRFYHVVGLRLETTSAQMRTAINEVQHYLSAHPSVDLTEAVRVRLVRLNRFALDVELCVYIRAGDWEGFLETQQELLLDVMGILERAGAEIALPAQTLHLTDARSEPMGVGAAGPSNPARFRSTHNAGS